MTPSPWRQRRDFGARLHARPLLGQHEFTAVKIALRLGEQDRDLQRKKVLAVHVLMQAIVVAGAVAQQKRRRARLAGLTAAREERVVLGWIADRSAHRFIPPVRNRREPRIEAPAKRDNRLRQRIGEIFVLAPAKAMFRHHDSRAEAGVVGIERRKLATGLRRDEFGRDRATVGVEFALDRGPGERADRGRALIRPFGPPSPRGRRGARRRLAPLPGERGWGEGFLEAGVGVRALSRRGAGVRGRAFITPPPGR